jgi:hypothetical protein
LVEKVLINWTYSCEEPKWKATEEQNSIKSLELKGKYEFQIDKQYIINVKYEEHRRIIGD